MNTLTTILLVIGLILALITVSLQITNVIIPTPKKSLDIAGFVMWLIFTIYILAVGVYAGLS